MSFVTRGSMYLNCPWIRAGTFSRSYDVSRLAVCFAGQETISRIEMEKTGTNLSKSEVKEDVLSRGMADQKAIVGESASNFQQISVCIFK
jgi:hypothetical protein